MVWSTWPGSSGSWSGWRRRGPVDLGSHDWGGGFVVRVVSTRPDLVRSWVTDAAGIGDVDFEWHDIAKIWQTPGAGEGMFEQVLAQPPEQWAGTLESLGVPHDDAVAIATSIDRTMAGCILALYRSLVDAPGPAWRRRAARALLEVVRAA